MESFEIKNRFNQFFQKRNHKLLPSASVISPNPSTLFTIAGMVPFIPYFLGVKPAPYKRVATVQKCVRTADIDQVGKTTRHGTFFQMNGNFSFGDYFKYEAISYAWQLLTTSQSEGGYGLYPSLLWITIYQDDLEAASIWQEITGFSNDRIQKLGRAENYWHTGAAGPGGPCSEICLDFGSEFGIDGGPRVNDNRFVEIWNLVFQYQQIDNVKSKTQFDIVGDLPTKNIDTGMGLERLATYLQGKKNIYEIDEIRPVIDKVANLTDKAYGRNNFDDIQMRILADHIRSALMIMSDGVVPSNEGRGYVLRRLLRRSIRSVRLLGYDKPIMKDLFDTSLKAMSPSYVELSKTYNEVLTKTVKEEDIFSKTLKSGTKLFNQASLDAKKPSGILQGEDAFKLHDTYGFPIELTLEMAAEAGVKVDKDKFVQLMSEQKQRARQAYLAKRQAKTNTTAYNEVVKELKAETQFLGYETANSDIRVLAIVENGKPVSLAKAPSQVEVIFDKTPFYAEGGGQVADIGIAEFSNGALFNIEDVQKPLTGLFVHTGTLTEGVLTVGDKGVATIDLERRKAICRAHSATHMIHKALQEQLGSHATQAGSLDEPGRLRFDFRNDGPMTDEALQMVESRVNTLLEENLDVADKLMNYDKALESGAMAIFGEKYGDIVRVVSIGDTWSRELCGGTHVAKSSQIGLISILSESSIGSGVRRVDALVGTKASQYHAKEKALVNQLTGLLNSSPDQLTDKVKSLMEQLKAQAKTITQIRKNQLLASADNLLKKAVLINNITCIVENITDANNINSLKQVAEKLQNKLSSNIASFIMLIGIADSKLFIVCLSNKLAVEKGLKAGEIVKSVTKFLDGGGGGRPEFATGGGSNVAKIPQAVVYVKNQIKNI
ncbi:MAG: alanine--tRNA ligase [Bifidobacteriaceae bacterium]|nr:alanine--tRNA ligase [Bifidobacteriaceae bacterium]